MSEVCIILNGNTQIQAFVTNLEALIGLAALEIGKKCSIASTLDSFVGEDIKEAIETAVREVINAANTVLRTINNILNSYNALLQTGINTVISFLDTAYALVNSSYLSIDGIITNLAKLIANAVNGLFSAACGALNQVMGTIPSQVALVTPGIAAAQAVLDTGKPQEYIAKFLKNAGVDDLKRNIISAKSNLLSNLPIAPNVAAYTCVPI